MAHEKLHSSEHTDGTDDIQTATNSQKGLASIDVGKAIGPLVMATSNTTLTAADSGTLYAAIQGGGDDPIVFSLPASGAVKSLRFFIFNASGKSIQFAADGEAIYLNMPGSVPSKVQLDDNFGWLEIISSGGGSWVAVSGSGRWFNADSPTDYHLFDGNDHDGTDLIYTLNKGAHKFVTEAQRAQGLLTVDGTPIADETFVVDGTTITAKADGSGDVDWFTIGGTNTETANNILATLLEGSEKDDTFARKSGGNKVLVEWAIGGVIGNGKTFTESMTGVSMDGSGTLGGTHFGVDAATLFTIDKNGVVTATGGINIPGATTDNFASFDGDANIKDSGEKASDFCEDKFEETIFIPIEDFIDGATPPTAIATLTDGLGKVKIRDFAGTVANEDALKPWLVPKDMVVADNVKFRIVGFISAGTGPASGEGVCFSLAGFCIGVGDALGGTFGTLQSTIEPDLYGEGVTAQYDHFTTPVATLTTITNLAAGEVAMLKVERHQDNANDDYEQEIGVSGILITYNRKPTGVA